MIKFLFFAQLAEYAECDSLELEHQAGHSASDYVSTLAELLPAPAIELMNDGATMLSVNQVLASWDDGLNDDDEVGLLPPFSGG